MKRVGLEVEFGCSGLIPSGAPFLFVEAGVDIKFLLIVSHPLGDDWGFRGSLILKGCVVLDELHQCHGLSSVEWDGGKEQVSWLYLGDGFGTLENTSLR